MLGGNRTRPQTVDHSKHAAFEVERRGVHEHQESSLKRSRLLSNSSSPMWFLSHNVAPGCDLPARSRVSSSPSQTHGAIEMMEFEFIDAVDAIIVAPMLAGPV